ncbi:uncharacterized protein LOC110861978 [Folsomia candida]|uniref:Uncharacterized protein n=1 Tax=Folsomia candida TaxID=158441 RepID=A0A226D032_FOLCA|nr:uncharacterized protein LOC110861978 [Folsomia candida]OXA38224.1 hypothetical protein Fcan01_27014 [Folsomia candida]
MQSLESPGSPISETGSVSDLEVCKEFLREEKEKLDVLEAEVVQYKRNLEPALQRVREIEENISIRENQIKKIKILRAHMKRAEPSEEADHAGESLLESTSSSTTPSTSTVIVGNDNMANVTNQNRGREIQYHPVLAKIGVWISFSAKNNLYSI